jgi:hypothetical protein
MKNFVTKGTPEEVSGVAAVTLQAGEQWLGMSAASRYVNGKYLFEV